MLVVLLDIEQLLSRPTGLRIGPKNGGGVEAGDIRP